MKLLTKFYYPHFDFQACREELLLPGLEYHAAMVGGGASGAVVGEEDTDTVVVEAAPINIFWGSVPAAMVREDPDAMVKKERPMLT